MRNEGRNENWELFLRRERSWRLVSVLGLLLKPTTELEALSADRGFP